MNQYNKSHPKTRLSTPKMTHFNSGPHPPDHTFNMWSTSPCALTCASITANIFHTLGIIHVVPMSKSCVFVFLFRAFMVLNQEPFYIKLNGCSIQFWELDRQCRFVLQIRMRYIILWTATYSAHFRLLFTKALPGGLTKPNAPVTTPLNRCYSSQRAINGAIAVNFPEEAHEFQKMGGFFIDWIWNLYSTKECHMS